MIDLVSMAALVLGLGSISLLLGVVGFFRAGQALREIAELRQRLAPATPPLPVPAAMPTPTPNPMPAQPTPVTPTPTPTNLEALVTARWGVWLGAATLLLAGIFLVRWAADEGWLDPAVRCTALATLGIALLALAFRTRPATTLRFADQVPPGLAAGGVAMLFAAAYAAGIVYALVSPLAAFLLMAAASLVGLAAALRLGPLVAAIGIAGAFATPLLVPAPDASTPLLFAYLLFVSAASLAVVRYAAWVWLGWATTIAGAAWVLLATLDIAADDWSAALFVPALVSLHLSLLPGAALESPIGRRLAWLPVLALGAAGLLLALADPGWPTRAGLLLLAPVTLGAAARDERLTGTTWVAVALFLALMAAWGLPAWSPSGQAVGDGFGGVTAILPGDWMAPALRPFLSVLAGMALLYAAAGLAGAWLRRRTVAWAALAAAVPPLALALGFARLRQFQPDAAWAAASLAVAAGLVAATALAMRTGRTRQTGGVLAAGAVATLALGCAALLSAEWLTMALVLLVPALLWIEAEVDLPPLRRVALAVVSVALVRLLLNVDVLSYVIGAPPVLNGRALAYATAALSFFASARIARRRTDDLLVTVLELGSAAFVTALVALEIRQWATAGQPGRQSLAFPEAGLQLSALATLACIAFRLDRRHPRPSLRWTWTVQGALALLGGTALVVANPLWTDATIDGPPLFDALLTAYAIPALLALATALQCRNEPRLARTLTAYGLAAALTWLTLEIRHLAHPGAIALADVPVLPWELWAWSGAWLAAAVALMLAGLLGDRRPLRLAALAVMAVVIPKVFLVDMAGLTGLWRVLSFLGLGLALIAIGRLYGLLSRPDAAHSPP